MKKDKILIFLIGAVLFLGSLALAAFVNNHVHHFVFLWLLGLIIPFGIGIYLIFHSGKNQVRK
jgi:hypothetical protein